MVLQSGQRRLHEDGTDGVRSRLHGKRRRVRVSNADAAREQNSRLFSLATKLDRRVAGGYSIPSRQGLEAAEFANYRRASRVPKQRRSRGRVEIVHKVR